MVLISIFSFRFTVTVYALILDLDVKFLRTTKNSVRIKVELKRGRCELGLVNRLGSFHGFLYFSYDETLGPAEILSFFFFLSLSH